MNKYLKIIVGFKNGIRSIFLDLCCDVLDVFEDLWSVIKVFVKVVFVIVVWLFFLCLVVFVLFLVIYFCIKWECEVKEKYEKVRKGLFECMLLVN